VEKPGWKDANCLPTLLRSESWAPPPACRAYKSARGFRPSPADLEMRLEATCPRRVSRDASFAGRVSAALPIPRSSCSLRAAVRIMHLTAPPQAHRRRSLRNASSCGGPCLATTRPHQEALGELADAAEPSPCKQPQHLSETPSLYKYCASLSPLVRFSRSSTSFSLRIDSRRVLVAGFEVLPSLRRIAVGLSPAAASRRIYPRLPSVCGVWRA